LSPLPEGITLADNRGKFAAAASAAVVAVGGATAHFSGAFRTSADDVGRGVGRGFDDLPPTRDPPLPTRGAGENAATDDLVREGMKDVEAKEITCFAYENFVDDATGEFVAPTEAEFVEAVVTQLAPEGSQLSYRLKAESLYEKLSDPETDWEDVAIELTCF
jgi:hypothetical protein